MTLAIIIIIVALAAFVAEEWAGYRTGCHTRIIGPFYVYDYSGNRRFYRRCNGRGRFVDWPLPYQ